MQVVTNLEELDAKLLECETARQISDTALREVFSTFRMEVARDLPNDPFSEEYRVFQSDLYERIAGRKYSPENEKTPFDIAEADRRPFPFSSRDSKTAGFFTVGLGFFLQRLDLAPGARILEFGSGWGNTTLAMAMLGFDVTAVDIERNFCELLTLRAKRHEVEITIINDDFSWAERTTEKFDAVVFFECFHHCADHRRLLDALHNVLKPGGKIYFSAEPITNDFPVPWGLRMDGESLWAVRAAKWLELGFQEDYFEEALRRSGWIAKKHAVPNFGWASTWEARRTSELGAVTTTTASERQLGTGSTRTNEGNRLLEIVRATKKKFRLRSSNPIIGSVDIVTENNVAGWAYNPAKPDAPIKIELLIGREVVASGPADMDRADLAQLGYGDGKHGFSLLVTAEIRRRSRPWRRARIRVTSEANQCYWPIKIPRDKDFDRSRFSAAGWTFETKSADGVIPRPQARQILTDLMSESSPRRR